MNVYDFDGTIYDGDSSIDFYLFCIKNKPIVFFRCLPKQLCGAILYFCKLIRKEKFKEFFFSFLKYSDVDNSILERFWNENEPHIKKWYLQQKNKNDVIISASPDFLLRPVCEKLGVSLIATKVDPSSGKIEGMNCHGKIKAERFYHEYPNAKIEKFYTDSKSDLPLAEIAKESFLLKKDTIIHFPFI